jgi:hypothetical protein
MNLQLLPEIAILTVPNFRGYFYTEISESTFPHLKN